MNRDLPRLPATQRIAEVIRYSLLRLEFWVSPAGRLREWLRLNVTVALLIGIPAIIVVPIITLLLEQLTSWSNYLIQLTTNFLMFPVLALAFVVLVTALLSFMRGMMRK